MTDEPEEGVFPTRDEVAETVFGILQVRDEDVSLSQITGSQTKFRDIAASFGIRSIRQDLLLGGTVRLLITWLANPERSDGFDVEC